MPLAQARPAPPPRRRRRPTAALLALAGVLACAAPGAAPQERAAASQPRDPGELVFWEVEGAAGRAWLLGSVHVGLEEFTYDPAILRAFDSADALVQELPPEDLQLERVLQMMLDRALLPEGRTLRDVLSPELYAILEERYRDREVEWLGLQRMEPWVLILVLSTEPFLEQGMTSEQGVDVHFQRLAQQEDMPILALETAESQIALFDEMPIEVQEQALADLLGGDTDDTLTNDAWDLLDAWSAGDLVALEALIFSELGRDATSDAFYDALLFRRNDAMTETLAKLLAQGGEYFVTVGAAHTLGERGIPSLLEAQGFRVRRVPRTR